MDYRKIRSGLRELRYWAALHSWVNSHEQEDHVASQKKNIAEVLKKWDEYFFKHSPSDWMFFLVDAQDVSKAKWTKRPFLAVQDEHIRRCLAIFIYLVQAYNKTMPSVLGFFLHRLGWKHGILSFQSGNNFLEDKRESVRIPGIPNNSFKDTWITLPPIERAEFYDNIKEYNYPNVNHEKSNLTEGPSNSSVNSGILDNANHEAKQIWGTQYDACVDFVKKLFGTPNHTPDDISRGVWVLANISWFMGVASGQNGRHHYHYYFFRSLAVKPDDFFHTTNHGLISWACPATAAANKSAIQRQTIALTASLTLSRIADSALPLYERRAITQFAQSHFGQKATLMWVLDRLLLPVMLGAKLENDTSNEFGFKNRSDNWEPIVVIPALGEFVKTLWPKDPWRPQCGQHKNQLKYILELIAPLMAEVVPQNELESFKSITHQLKNISLTSDTNYLNAQANALKVAQIQLATAGALFVPAQRALQKVVSAFNDWRASTTEISEKLFALTERVNKFEQDFDSLGTLASLESLINEWGEDGVIRKTPCGKALTTESLRDVTLPFYITDLDLAYRALRDNWVKYDQGQKDLSSTNKSYFHCCVLPKRTFFVSWREEIGWCSDYEEWKTKVWASLAKVHASSRGLPLVLRFAAQNKALHLWVRTNDGSINIILGNADDVNKILETCCATCLSKQARSVGYEVGMLFQSAPDSSSSKAP